MNGQDTAGSSLLTTGNRPETSPYNEPNVLIQLLNDDRLYIPAHLVRKCPQLEEKANGTKKLSLDITLDVGHTLVHYLSTGDYQCLKTKESSPYGSRLLDLKTALEVYKVALIYDLPQLQNLARNEIQSLGDETSAPVIFHLLQEICNGFQEEDVWLSGFFKSRLKSFLETPSDPQQMQYDRSKGNSWQMSDMLFKGLYELQTEKIISKVYFENQVSTQDQEDIYTAPTPPLEPRPDVPEHENRIETNGSGADHVPLMDTPVQPTDGPFEARVSPFVPRVSEVVDDSVLQGPTHEDDALLARLTKSKKARMKEKKAKRIRDASIKNSSQVASNEVTDAASSTNPGQPEVTSLGTMFSNIKFDKIY